MPKLKSERHHWWPRCLSSRWAAEDGKTGWVKPDGSCIRLPPDQLGVIRNAHHITFGSGVGDSTAWDSSFEDEFDDADTHFPAVVAWLEGLERYSLPQQPLRDRFISQPATDEQLRMLTESVVSLAVRSPMNREASVALAEHLRGPIGKPERNALIGSNMWQSQRLIADSIGANAKFAVLFSPSREFIFGDGFFHNVTAMVNRPMAPKMLAPITPNVSVIIARPTSYIVQPRLTTIVLSDAEVDLCNDAVQVYARRALYFRSDRPVIQHVFARDEHRWYSNADNPIDTLLSSVPGMRSRYGLFGFYA